MGRIRLVEYADFFKLPLLLLIMIVFLTIRVSFMQVTNIYNYNDTVND